MSRRSPALVRCTRCSHVWATGFQCVCLSAMKMGSGSPCAVRLAQVLVLVLQAPLLGFQR